MAKIQKTPTGEFHSGYGCVIMAAVVGVFAFIVWWGYYTLTTMDAAIAAVSQPSPVQLPAVQAAPGLEQKLSAFAAEVTAGKPATLKLSIAELNALLTLAPEGSTGSYKDMLRVKSLDVAKQAITTDVCLPLNKKFWENDKRYLVGEVDFSLEMTALGPDAKVSAVRVPGKPIPEEMVKGMAMYGYLGPYQNHATIGPVLKALKSCKVDADGVVVSTVEST